MLTAAELAMFGEPSREPGSDDGDPTPAVDVAKLTAPGVTYGATRLIPTATPVADPGLPPPKARKRKAQIMPDCGACSAPLNPDNASQLKGGEWVHVGCPATGMLFTQTPVPVVATQSATPTPGTIGALEAAFNAEQAKPFAQRFEETAVRAISEAWATPGPGVIQIELGPETLKILKALLSSGLTAR